MNNLILSFVLLVIVQFASAQSDFTGNWEGKLNAGVEIRIAFKISKTGDIFSALMDCPDQGLKDVQTTVSIKADSVSLTIPQFRAKYSGKLLSDNTISGTFYQGMSFPLALKKVDKVQETVRMQTPLPPFPYQSEDVTYTNSNQSISYGATITVPNGKGPFPAALLLTGSGQQNRDEEIGGHKPFAVIADHLTKNGFVVLRVDDRGIGKTSGDFRSATSKDFADDAIVSLNYLKSRNDVDQKKIGLIGHSEGGMLAQMIAAERKDVSFVVLLAAPGVPIKKLMHDQNEAVLKKSGLPQDYITSYIGLYDSIIESAASSGQNKLSENVKKIVDEWIVKTPGNVVAATTGISDETSKTNFVKGFVGQIGSPWFQYFLNYDPTNNLKKIKVPVLALNGSEDVQVLADPNLSAIESALASNSKKSSVKKLPGLNHLFQECKTCSVAEYTKIEQTISPLLLNSLTEWLISNPN